MISEKNFDISLNPTNLFTSDVPVKGKAYCRLFIDVVGEGSWEVISDSTYDIINDVIVFPVQPSGKYLSLQVSTTPAELTQSPTENSMIMTIKNEIKKVADNMENVITLSDTVDVIVPNITKVGVVADNILDVNKVATDITKVGVVATDITKVGVVATDITKVGAVATNITKVNAVGGNIPKVINVDANMAKISNVDANITKISNVDANIPKISNVSANMTDINNAEENAQLALYYKNLAKKWASELEDVVVADGKFSAYHWALKAYKLVTKGVINDITSSTTTTYSSDKLDDLLALKANLLNPIFSKSASIGGVTLSSWGNTYSVIEGISGSFYGNDGLNTIVGNNAYFDGNNWRYKANGRATLQVLSADSHIFNTALSGSANNVITWNIVATLSNDNVLVPYIQNQIDNINTKLITHVPLSDVASYHLLQGNLSVSNKVITNGFSTTLYTGNGDTQSINTGVDMSTQWGNDASEMFGGLYWIKSRSIGYGLQLYDTVRGATKVIRPASNIGESTVVTGLTSFNNNGFNVGSLAGINENASNNVSWNFQTTHRRTGVTNHGKAYTEHYNPYTGFTIIKYEGSGIAVHEIPHSLGRKLDFSIIKNLSATSLWFVKPDSNSLNYLTLSTSNALSSENSGELWSNELNGKFIVNTNVGSNTSGDSYILYGWANSYYDVDNTLIGNYEIGIYQGTGVAGNKVTTRGKPAWLMTKRLDSTGSWVIVDNKRGTNPTKALYTDLSDAEASPTPSTYMQFNSDSFTINATTVEINAWDKQYLYMVVYDNDSGSGKSKYPKATDTTNLSINALVPYANGIDVNGSKVSISYKNETITGLTLTQGKNYPYSKNDGTYGSNKYLPVYGKLRDRVIAGENYDYFDLETRKWYGTSGGGELITNGTFDTNTAGWTATASVLSVVSGAIKVTSNSDLYGTAEQAISTIIGKKYKFIGKITAKSNTQCGIYIEKLPGNIGNGTLVNTDITVSIGSYTLEFVAQTTTTYIKLVAENISGYYAQFDDISVFESTPIVDAEITPRTYLDCTAYADQNGQVTYVEELPKIEYKDVIKANEFQGKNACTAWVNFDGTTTPPTIRDSYNVSAVIRIATGIYDVYFDKETMDNLKYTVSAPTLYGTSNGVVGALKYLNKVTLQVYNGGALTSGFNDISIQVFGGKN